MAFTCLQVMCLIILASQLTKSYETGNNFFRKLGGQASNGRGWILPAAYAVVQERNKQLADKLPWSDDDDNDNEWSQYRNTGEDNEILEDNYKNQDEGKEENYFVDINDENPWVSSSDTWTEEKKSVRGSDPSVDKIAYSCQLCQLLPIPGQTQINERGKTINKYYCARLNPSKKVGQQQMPHYSCDLRTGIRQNDLEVQYCVAILHIHGANQLKDCPREDYRTHLQKLYENAMPFIF